MHGSYKHTSQHWNAADTKRSFWATTLEGLLIHICFFFKVMQIFCAAAVRVVNANKTLFLFQRMTDKCFKKCIGKPGSTLDNSEQVCTGWVASVMPCCPEQRSDHVLRKEGITKVLQGSKAYLTGAFEWGKRKNIRCCWGTASSCRIIYQVYRRIRWTNMYPLLSLHQCLVSRLELIWVGLSLCRNAPCMHIYIYIY